MKIFYRRPLSLILCIMLGAFSLFSKIDEPYNYILWSIALILFPLSFIKPLFRKIPRTLFRVVLIAFLISSILSHHYFKFYYKAYERFDGEVNVTAEITEIKANDFYTYLTVESKTINTESFSNYKFLLMLDLEEMKEITDLKCGKYISFIGKISDFKEEKSDFDANSYYLSKGYSGKITNVSDVSLSGEERKNFSSYFHEARVKTAEFIIEKSDEESGGFLAALLLGEKAFLSPAINLDFQRIGISHILALSGMHLAILALGFSKLLSLFGFGKKFSSIITIIFTVGYMALTGFPISVVRAGIMLIISYLLFLFANASDSLTNLSISVFLIVLVSPYAIFDISLLLSAFATLGIVALGDLPRKREKNKGVKNKILNSLCISLFALSGTFLLSVLSFGEISLISPVSTLVFSVLCEIFLYFGTFFLIFANLFPLGDVLIFLGNTIKDLAHDFSKLKYITVSTDFIFINIAAIIFTIIFALFLILSIRRKRLGVLLISGLMSLILVIGSLFTYSAENTENLIYYGSEDGDAILITDSGEISLIESKTYMRSKTYETLKYLKTEKLTRLDNYIVTGYNEKMPSALYQLLSDVKISNIYVPIPNSEEEADIYYKLLSLKSTFNVNISYYDNCTLEFQSVAFTAKYREERLGIFEIIHKNKKYLMASSGILVSDGLNLALYEIFESDCVIFMRYGKSYKNYNFVYEFKKPQVLIISSKGMYTSEYIQNFYKNSGADIRLTPEKYDFIR